MASVYFEGDHPKRYPLLDIKNSFFQKHKKEHPFLSPMEILRSLEEFLNNFQQVGNYWKLSNGPSPPYLFTPEQMYQFYIDSF